MPRSTLPSLLVLRASVRKPDSACAIATMILTAFPEKPADAAYCLACTVERVDIYFSGGIFGVDAGGNIDVDTGGDSGAGRGVGADVDTVKLCQVPGSLFSSWETFSTSNKPLTIAG